MCSTIPNVVLLSSSKMPLIAFGTASSSNHPQIVKAAVIEAIKVGYRHFDTASIYGSEQALGEAIAEALKLRLIASRDELFITSKLWIRGVESCVAAEESERILQSKGIVVIAYSPLGAKGSHWGSNEVMDNEVLKQIADAHGKTVAQVSLRWQYEQGVTFAVKSYNKDRIKENFEIFDFSLTNDDNQKIDEIKQERKVKTFVISDLWDEEN
ncbi:hypothetical protein PIB30_016706 [Stylosanthes scabra]|uniref:NADP-dependent oxidoreductase domain-containing protein n=1 Tax=Stylosanthes scabra TaxID=79078 RepID=A0ABU6Y5P5_9FABA|nr:hypothetical protein [Stylosanthes scabra]